MKSCARKPCSLSCSPHVTVRTLIPHVPTRLTVMILVAMFQSISLQHTAERTLKQTLLAITIWFRHGSNAKVLHAFQKNLKETQHKAWLNVLPQLIARLGTKDERLRASLLEFLLAVARSFPHAVIWPLLTAAETPRSIHQTAAREIMEKMRDNANIARMVAEVCRDSNAYDSQILMCIVCIRLKLSRQS